MREHPASDRAWRGVRGQRQVLSALAIVLLAWSACPGQVDTDSAPSGRAALQELAMGFVAMLQHRDEQNAPESVWVNPAQLAALFADPPSDFVPPGLERDSLAQKRELGELHLKQVTDRLAQCRSRLRELSMPIDQIKLSDVELEPTNYMREQLTRVPGAKQPRAMLIRLTYGEGVELELKLTGVVELDRRSYLYGSFPYYFTVIKAAQRSLEPIDPSGAEDDSALLAQRFVLALRSGDAGKVLACWVSQAQASDASWSERLT